MLASNTATDHAATGTAEATAHATTVLPLPTASCDELRSLWVLATLGETAQQSGRIGYVPPIELFRDGTRLVQLAAALAGVQQPSIETWHPVAAVGSNSGSGGTGLSRHEAIENCNLALNLLPEGAFALAATPS